MGVLLSKVQVLVVLLTEGSKDGPRWISML